MSDPIDQNNPPSTPPPTLPDPQALVDAALSPTPAATPAPPTTPTEPSMPTVPPAPEPVAPVTPPPAPEPTPAPPVAYVAMGDDTPLAFVTPPPSSSAPSTEPKPPVDGAAPLPPVPPAPSATEVPKKKKKGLKILGLIAGFFLLVVVGGALAYQMLGTTGLVAYVNKFTRDDSGKVIINPDWDPNAVNPDTGKTQEEERNEALGIKQEETSSSLPAEKAGSPDNCGTDYAWCGGGISKCVSYDALQKAGGGCNKYGEVEYGIPTVYGANYSKPDAKGQCAIQKCDCGSTPICFDKTGYCDQRDTSSKGGVVGTNYNQMGLCALAGTYSSDRADATFTPNDPTLTPTGYKCTDSNCTTTDSNCTTMRYTCSGTVGGNSCTDRSSAFISKTQPAMTTSFTGKCGTVEQVDVMCGGVYTASRTRINPDCTESDTPPASEPPASAPPGTPVMACTGLTQAPAAPKVGDKVTFTCSGTITPSTAGTLSYKFRYSINNATPSAMVNKTATTTELSVAACGEYKVECQTCATIAGVLKCDPNWVGATQ